MGEFKADEGVVKRNRSKLEELLRMPSWHLQEAVEAVNLAAPIFVPWAERIIESKIKYTTLAIIFSNYSPFVEFEKSEIGTVLGPLHNRVVIRHKLELEKGTNLPEDVNEWLLSCIENEDLRKMAQAIPKDYGEYYSFIAEKFLPKLIDYGLGLMDSKFEYTSLQTLLTRCDPRKEKPKINLKKDRPAIKFVFRWQET